MECNQGLCLSPVLSPGQVSQSSYQTGPISSASGSRMESPALVPAPAGPYCRPPNPTCTPSVSQSAIAGGCEPSSNPPPFGRMAYLRGQYERKVNPISASLSDIINFLAGEFHPGKQYCTLNVYRSAISMTHPVIDSVWVGSTV